MVAPSCDERTARSSQFMKAVGLWKEPVAFSQVYTLSAIHVQYEFSSVDMTNTRGNVPKERTKFYSL